MSLQSIENKFYFDLWAENHTLMTVTFYWYKNGKEVECRRTNMTYNQCLAIAKSEGYQEIRWYKPWTWLNCVVTVG